MVVREIAILHFVFLHCTAVPKYVSVQIKER